MTEGSKRRWCSVSLRELALILLACGLAAGWYREHTEFAPIKACVPLGPHRNAKYPSLVTTAAEINGVHVCVSVYPTGIPYQTRDQLPLFVRDFLDNRE